jgi:hypothetical protein
MATAQSILVDGSGAGRLEGTTMALTYSDVPDVMYALVGVPSRSRTVVRLSLSDGSTQRVVVLSDTGQWPGYLLHSRRLFTCNRDDTFVIWRDLVDGDQGRFDVTYPVELNRDPWNRSNTVMKPF